MPTNYPRLTAGNYGVVQFHHMNRLFASSREVDRLLQQQSGPGQRPQDARAPTDLLPWEDPAAIATDTVQIPNVPLGALVEWREQFLHEDCRFGEIDADTYVRTSVGTQRQACHLSPKRGFVRILTDENGAPSPVWIPVTSVLGCRIVEVLGTPPSHTYEIETLDESIKTTPAPIGGLLPRDREDGFNYEALPVGEFAMLQIVNDTGDLGADVRLYAFETKMKAQCPPPIGAAGSSGPPIAINSWMGL